MSEWTPRRVVVTGLGLVTPLDIGVPKAWEKLCQGQCALREK
jgi:3-oxoacyl-[acyl-carrier-protein] synthase II